MDKNVSYVTKVLNKLQIRKTIRIELLVPLTKNSKDRVKHDSFRVFNAFVTRFSCVCMKRVLKRVDSRFSRYKRVSQQPIKSALQ